MIAHQWIRNKISPWVSGNWEFASPLENLCPERSQDAEPTFGWPDCTLDVYHEFQEDSVLKQICKNKTGFYLKTVRGDN